MEPEPGAARAAASAAFQLPAIPAQIRDWPRWFPFPRPMALYGRILLPRGLRARLEQEDPEALLDILDHEMMHVARQHARGMLRWHLLYVLSKRFRWNEEKAAYASCLGRRVARGDVPTPEERERLSQILSGRPYVYMTDGPTARSFICAVIRDAQAG